MAGLVPAIHVFLPEREDVDARDQAGHGGMKLNASAREKAARVAHCVSTTHL
jgi:hypothetical protein